MIFLDRNFAGEQLVEKLSEFKNDAQAIVLGLPRGGVVVANVVAKILNLPLDILVTRKISAPFSEELAIGAITEDGEPILNDELVTVLDVSDEYLKKEIETQRKEVRRRLEKYRQGRGELTLTNRTAIIIDDGIATGFTMLAAIKLARNKGAAKIIVAVPVIASDTVEKLRQSIDQLVYLDRPQYFEAIGQFYKNFDQVSDEEVEKIMQR